MSSNDVASGLPPKSDFAAHSDADARDAAQARWCALTSCAGAKTAKAETPEAAAFRREAADASDAKDTKQAVGFALGGAGIGAFLLVRNGGGAEKTASAKFPLAHASAAPLPGGGLATATLTF